MMVSQRHAELVARWQRDAMSLRTTGWAPPTELADELVEEYLVAKRQIKAGTRLLSTDHLTPGEAAGNLLQIYGLDALRAIDLQPRALRRRVRRWHWKATRALLSKALDPETNGHEPPVSEVTP